MHNFHSIQAGLYLLLAKLLSCCCVLFQKHAKLNPYTEYDGDRKQEIDTGSDLIMGIP